VGQGQNAPLTAPDLSTSGADISDVLVRLDPAHSWCVRRGGVMTSITPKPTSSDQVASAVPGPRRWHVGGVVAGSLAAGFAAAVILPFLPVGTVDADFATAMVLFGFAFGWALLAVLSTRFTDQPQRWAVAPAIFMVLSGALVLLAPDAMVDALGWIWPPALLV
jgi:hypothetical protein